MTTTIELHPAKRILAIYVISFASVVLLLIFIQNSLPPYMSLDPSTLYIAWMLVAICGVVLFGYGLLWRLTSVFTVSSLYVSSTTGILSMKHMRIPVNRIIDYRVDTPLFERILGLASVHIDTAGGENIVMQQLSQHNVDLLLRRLDKMLNKERLRTTGTLSGTSNFIP